MSATRRPTARINVETLEDRCVPSTASLSNGILRIVGTDAAETIRVDQSGSQITVQGLAARYNAASIRGVVVEARGGNDTVDLRSLRVGATVYGGFGNDFVVGTQAGDYLSGDDGNDRLFGMQGNDSLYGGNGNDLLFGMSEIDALFGQNGNDFLDDGNRSGQEYADGGAGMDFNADVVAVAGTSYTDIRQGNLPTCGFLSSLSGLARTGSNFTQWISYAGFTSDGTPQYNVSFWTGARWTQVRVNFDGNLTGNDTTPTAEGESWVVLMERAWVQYHGNAGRTYPHEAIFALTGRSSAVQYSLGDADFNRISSALARNQLVVTATGTSPYSNMLVENHAYTVVGVWGSGSNRWVQVRNPWGVDGRVASGDAADGLIWLRWSDFTASMRYLSIT